MKICLLLLIAPFAFVSCADSGSGTDDPANSVPPAKQVTKKQNEAGQGYIQPSSLHENSTDHSIAHRGKDSFKKYAVKESPYGTLKDAAAPPTREELAAEPDPVNMPEKNIITPPTGG